LTSPTKNKTEGILAFDTVAFILMRWKGDPARHVFKGI
jgi:hypothetical protein